MFGNIKKYLMYLLSANLGEIGLLVGASLLGAAAAERSADPLRELDAAACAAPSTRRNRISCGARLARRERASSRSAWSR